MAEQTGGEGTSGTARLAPDAVRLTPEQVARLQALDIEIEWVRREIKRARGVGINVDSLEKELEHGVQLRDRLLKEYG